MNILELILLVMVMGLDIFGLYLIVKWHQIKVTSDKLNKVRNENYK